MYSEDDEEAAVLTPEQLAERERIKKEEEKARENKLNTALEKARLQLEGNDFEAALYTLNKVEDIAEKNGEYYVLKLKTLTRNFTDFLSLEKSAEAAEGVKAYADAEAKAQLNSLAEGYKI